MLLRSHIHTNSHAKTPSLKEGAPSQHPLEDFISALYSRPFMITSQLIGHWADGEKWRPSLCISICPCSQTVCLCVCVYESVCVEGEGGGRCFIRENKNWIVQFNGERSQVIISWRENRQDVIESTSYESNLHPWPTEIQSFFSASETYIKIFPSFFKFLSCFFKFIYMNVLCNQDYQASWKWGVSSILGSWLPPGRLWHKVRKYPPFTLLFTIVFDPIANEKSVFEGLTFCFFPGWGGRSG